jgi:hypothetical protein
MFQPLVFKLDNGDSSILDKPNDNIILSPTINDPLISLGFHNYIHRTRKIMDIEKNTEINKKTFYAPNPFEVDISNYEDSIKNLTKLYLGNKYDTHDFYKLWEILFLFDIANKKELTYGVLSDNHTNLSQAVSKYRDKFGNNLSQAKISGLNLKNIKEFGKNKHNFDLIIADGENFDDEINYQEQTSYSLIFEEIIVSLKTQAKNGNIILKIFDTFTIPTIKFVYILSSFYDETYLYKPFLSRPSSSEKYIVCKNFKYDQKKDSVLLDKKIKVLEDILSKMNIKKYVFDIFPKLSLPREYLTKFTFINTKLVNLQQIMINEYKKFYDEDNFYGDKFHKFKDKQIEATKWWVNNFYPPSNNLYIKNKEELQKILKSTLEKYQAEQNKFLSILI